MNHSNLPVAVIGAGPVGLAAAAHLVARGLQPLVFEAGAGPGASVRGIASALIQGGYSASEARYCIGKQARCAA